MRTSFPSLRRHDPDQVHGSQDHLPLSPLCGTPRRIELDCTHIRRRVKQHPYVSRLSVALALSVKIPRPGQDPYITRVMTPALLAPRRWRYRVLTAQNRGPSLGQPGKVAGSIFYRISHEVHDAFGSLDPAPDQDQPRAG